MSDSETIAQYESAASASQASFPALQQAIKPWAASVQTSFASLGFLKAEASCEAGKKAALDLNTAVANLLKLAGSVVKAGTDQAANDQARSLLYALEQLRIQANAARVSPVLNCSAPEKGKAGLITPSSLPLMIGAGILVGVLYFALSRRN